MSITAEGEKMKISAGPYCDQKRIRDYLDNNLEEDEQFEFLLHLDDCQVCRDTLYAAMKGAHDHYYKKVSGNKLKKELKEISKLVKEDIPRDNNEMTDVA